MGTIIIIAAYGAYAAFWIRFFLHALAWWRGRAEDPVTVLPRKPFAPAAWALGTRDVLLFWRLLKVNPALWFGEYLFHTTLLLVVLRHLRYFLDPVPGWVWDLQLPGLIAGYVLPCSLVYILVVRLASERERYSSPANMLLLAVILAISGIGLLMRWTLTPNLVDVKYFALGLVSLSPAPLPAGALFLLHAVLVLVLVVLVPSHIIAAPLVMLEARRRELGLKLVMHEE